MTAVAKCTCMDHLPAVSGWLQHAESAKVINEARPHANEAAKVSSMVRENVIAQLANIQTHPSVRLAQEKGLLNLHGWVYDIETGSIDALDADSRALCRWSSIRALVRYRPRRSKPLDQNCRLRKKVTALAAVTDSAISAFDAQIDLGHAATNGEHAITGENRTASKQASALPVRKPQFRLVQRVLAVDPTGDAIADKRRVDRVVETLLSLGTFTDQ
jgi:hypothetical protein